MSSFVTNRATRYGKKARVEGNSYNNVLATTGVVDSKRIEHNSHRLVRGPTLKTTVIGDQHTKGLSIQSGLHSLDHPVGLNPDGRSDVAMGVSGQSGGIGDGSNLYPDDRIANPPFPVTLNGPGYLSFPQEIAIKSIRGDVHVSGEVQWQVGRSDSLDFGIEDTSGNAFTVSAVNGYSVRLGALQVVNALITWTGKGSASGALRVTGLKCPSSADRTLLRVVGNQGLTMSNIGGNGYVQYTSPNYNLMQDDPNSGGALATLTDANFATSGSLTITGIIALTCA